MKRIAWSVNRVGGLLAAFIVGFAMCLPGAIPAAAVMSSKEEASTASAARAASAAGVGMGAVPRLVRVEPPRDTARHIGDVVVYRALIDLPSGWVLDRDGVSGSGVEGGPIELRAHTTERADDAACPRCVWLSLRWQIFKGVRASEDLKTHPSSVRLRQGGQVAVLTLPPAVLAVSPLVNWDMRSAWLDSMRPGWRAQPFDVKARIQEAALALGVAAMSGIGWLWSSGRWLPRRGARPFAEALKALRARRNIDRFAPADVVDLRHCHRAFDASAGEVVFMETLEDYFSMRPAFAPLTQDVRALFMASRQAFFLPPDSGPDTSMTRQDLIDLVQRLSRAEFASLSGGAARHA